MPVQPFLITLLCAAFLSGCAAPSPESSANSSSRLQIAEEIFQKRCLGAGETINKVINDVEGVFLYKIRPRNANHAYQFSLTDPYGNDSGGDAYIISFLQGSYQAQTAGIPIPGAPPRTGYTYVEAYDPKDQVRYRYTGRVKAIGRKDATAPNVRLELERNPGYDLNIYAYVLDRTPATGPMPRYGVTYEDISTAEDRNYWIAGSSLKVVDTQTGETIAERIGYMMDPEQGNTSGGRAPWLMAADHACPSFRRNPMSRIRAHGAASQTRQAQDFVEKVLKPFIKK